MRMARGCLNYAHTTYLYVTNRFSKKPLSYSLLNAFKVQTLAPARRSLLGDWLSTVYPSHEANIVQTVIPITCWCPAMSVFNQGRPTIHGQNSIPCIIIDQLSNPDLWVVISTNETFTCLKIKTVNTHVLLWSGLICSGIKGSLSW